MYLCSHLGFVIFKRTLSAMYSMCVRVLGFVIYLLISPVLHPSAICISFWFLQVQNLALHCASASRATAVKSEFPDRKDAANFSLGQQQQQQQQPFPQTAQQQQVQPQQLAKQMATYPQQPTTTCVGIKSGGQANMTVTPAVSVAPSSTSSTALPLSQLLLSPSALCQARAVTTVTPSATVTHILVPTSSVSTSTQGYSLGSVTTKANINTQTLVVQPLQQTNATVDKGPVPIQPKTAQGHRLSVQLPPRHPPAHSPGPAQPGLPPGTPPAPHSCPAGGSPDPALWGTRRPWPWPRTEGMQLRRTRPAGIPTAVPPPW